MSVVLKHPTLPGIHQTIDGRDIKSWSEAGWKKVGKSDATPDPEQNAPRSTAPLDEHTESTGS